MNAAARPCRVGLVLCALSVGPSAQQLLHDFQSDGYMTSLARGADWDGDDLPDVLLRVVPFDGLPRVEARGGMSGALLWEVTQAQAGNDFGAALCVVGDVDGDGVADVAIGAPRHDTPEGVDSGRVWFVSGVDGSGIVNVTGADPFEHFGHALVAAGDQDSDGRGDVLVGAPGPPNATTYFGRVALISGLGEVIEARVGDAPGQEFGRHLAALGDVTGDGRVDFAVGAPLHEPPGFPADWNTGRVVVLEGPTLIRRVDLVGQATEQHFGLDVSGLGDLDLDGVPDLPVLAHDGIIDVLDGAAFSSLTSFQVHKTEGLGEIGDADGDGLVDLLVGRPDGLAPKTQSRVEVRGLPAGQILLEAKSLDAWHELGNTLVGFGDLDGDGIPDWGAGTVSSYAWVWSGRVRSVTSVGGALPGANGAPTLSWLGEPVAGGDVSVSVEHGPPGAPAWLVLGGLALPAPLFGGTLVPVPAVVAPLVLDGAGQWRVDATVPATLAGGPALLLQAWVADAGGPAGFTATDALSVLVH